jgi:tight adherence protein B
VNLGLLIVLALTLALLGGAVWLWSMARGKERNEGALSRLGGREEALPVLFTPDSPELRIPGVRWASQLLWRAGYESQPRSVAIMLGALLLSVLLILLLASPVAALLIDVIGLTLLYIVLTRRAAARRSQIIDQLPGYIENLLRILSAGNSLEESIGSAAAEAPDPIRPLFLSVGRQVRLGAPVDQVLAAAGDLYRLRDLKVLSLAANVNRRYGGSLRGVLRSLIIAIRQRAMAARELRALTAETRFSALVLSMVPIILTLWILYRNRDYYSAMYHDRPTGLALLLTAAGLQLAGVFVLWRMVNSIGEED